MVVYQTFRGGYANFLEAIRSKNTITRQEILAQAPSIGIKPNSANNYIYDALYWGYIAPTLSIGCYRVRHFDVLRDEDRIWTSEPTDNEA